MGHDLERSTHPDAQARPAQMSGFVERNWVAPDGLRLSARDYEPAEGPSRLPVICLHGLTRNARDFEDLAPIIAGLGRRVLAFDVRGRGRSAYDPDPMRYAVPFYVGDLIGWAGALGIRRAVFVGTSMGGLITMALAAVAPDLVGGAVLNDVGPEVSPEGLARILTYVGGGVAVDDWSQAAAYAQSTNGAAHPKLGEAEWMRFARRMFVERDGRLALDYDPAIVEPLRVPAAEPAPDVWPLFANLAGSRPLLLVRGALSDVLAPEVRDRMQAAAPHMSVCEVDNVGHAPTLGEQSAVAAVTRFLAEID
jgi:pimeloyl-ACP methyl ester carboxylesterase